MQTQAVLLPETEIEEMNIVIQTKQL